jgi:hypothetical protein
LKCKSLVVLEFGSVGWTEVSQDILIHQGVVAV